MNKCSDEKIKKCKSINKVCNPNTGRCNIIKKNTNINNINKCSDEKIKKCKSINKVCNPNTGRCNIIKNNINLKEKKSLTSKEKISKLKKIWNKVKLKSPNRSPKKKAFKIIIKHLLPFVTKTFTLKNRIKYANEIHKGFIKDFDLQKVNENKRINGDEFKIIKKNNYYVRNIHLYKKIGTDSVYGSIYNVKYKHNDKYYNVCGKIMCNTRDNINEIELVKKTTEICLKKETPHFPITYFDGYIIKNEELKKNNSYLPDSIKNCSNKGFMVNFNEMFAGDLKTFIDDNKYNNKKELLINSLEQIFISILTFHKKFNYSHNDCHWGNFLYHKIKPGGYMHYKINNKDIYIENLGYLWIIWDYGFINSLTKNNKFIDYSRVINAFISKYDNGWNKNLDSVNNKKNKLPILNRGLNIFYDLKDLTLLNANEYKLIDILFKYNTNVYIKPPNDEIINLGKPYVI
jgi:hypothetical protein